jgi:hypothetical protein
MLLYLPQKLQVVDCSSCIGTASTFLLSLATPLLFIQLFLDLTRI